MSASTSRAPPSVRTDYRCFIPLTSRWNDNDVFGHINNAEYYAFFDTAVMRIMIDQKVVSITGGPVGTVVAESGCRFYRQITFEDRLSIGVVVVKLGNSSVHYKIGIFLNDEEVAAADGHFVHVFVDRSSRRPVTVPESARAVLTRLTA